MSKQRKRSRDNRRISRARIAQTDEATHVCSEAYSLLEGDDGTGFEQKITVIFDKESNTYIKGVNSRRITQWYSPEDLKELTNRAEPGDLLETARGACRHWAVFVGIESKNGGRKEGFVLDFGKAPDFGKKASICKKPLSEVAGTSKVRINNSSDKKSEPTSDFNLVLKRAQRFEEGNQYNIFTNNCEHFAMYCRYGRTFGDSPHPIWGEFEKISLGSLAASIFAGGLTGLFIQGPITGVAGLGLGVCAVLVQAVVEGGKKSLKMQSGTLK